MKNLLIFFLPIPWEKKKKILYFQFFVLDSLRSSELYIEKWSASSTFVSFKLIIGLKQNPKTWYIFIFTLHRIAIWQYSF